MDNPMEEQMENMVCYIINKLHHSRPGRREGTAGTPGDHQGCVVFETQALRPGQRWGGVLCEA